MKVINMKKFLNILKDDFTIIMICFTFIMICFTLLILSLGIGIGYDFNKEKQETNIIKCINNDKCIQYIKNNKKIPTEELLEYLIKEKGD